MRVKDFKFFKEKEFGVFDVENIAEIIEIVNEYCKGFLESTYDIDRTYETEYGKVRCASWEGPLGQEPYLNDLERDTSAEFKGWEFLILFSSPHSNLMFEFKKELATKEEEEMGLEPPLLWTSHVEFTDDHVDDWN
jgi:hypothetical protein